MPIKHLTQAALAGLMVSILAADCVAKTPASAQFENRALSQADAEAFFRQWLAMIDANTPLDAYLKYLPDGEFEQWSYTNAEIKNISELRAYFTATWGSIKQNRNVIETLTTQPVENGRTKIVAEVDWTATTGDDQTLNVPLIYMLTVGPGASSNDPDGQYPKIYRYAIRRSN